MDIELLQIINGSHSLFIDNVVVTLTSGITWIPFYIALLYLVIRNNETMAQVAVVIGCAAMCVLITSCVTDLIVKPLVARPRPTMEPSLKYTIDIVNGIRGTGYSFFSAHAANTFGIAILLSLIVRSRLLAIFLILWSLINGYTRLYLGVHYPSDVLVGLLFGAVVGVVSYLTYLHFYAKVSPRLNYISTKYTKTGYSLTDIDVAISVLVLTFLYAIIRAVVIDI